MSTATLKISYTEFVIWRATYIRSKRFITENMIDAFKRDYPMFKNLAGLRKEGELVKTVCD